MARARVLASLVLGALMSLAATAVALANPGNPPFPK